MYIFEGSNLDDALELKNSEHYYNKIIFNMDAVAKSGSIKHVLKYILWKLEINGIAELSLSGRNDMLFSVSRFNFWQLMSVINTTIIDDVEIVTLNSNSVTLKKVKDSYTNNGISFGIVFSGAQPEISKLIASLDSILNVSMLLPNCEVVICGPSDFKLDLISEYLEYENVRYEAFDNIIESETNRILISKKKNYLYSKLTFNLCVLSHTRIQFPDDFISNMIAQKVDVATTKIVDSNDIDYLGFVLIGSFDTSKLNSAKSITGTMIGNNFLKYMRKRVAYADGGLIIINKNKIIESPFNENLAWGEGEDLELAHNSYNKGLVVDYIESVKCISTISKIKKSNIRNNNIINSIRNKLIECGML